MPLRPPRRPGRTGTEADEPRTPSVAEGTSPTALLAATRVGAWVWLDEDRRSRLVADTATLMHRFRWEAARGFELTGEIRATIAAHAALLTLELGLDCYRNVSAVIVHPSTIGIPGPHPVGPGLMSDAPLDLVGQANDRNPVLIAWDAAMEQARHPERGHNVVFHEFAHYLDMLDGWVDGTPPIRDATDRRRWVEVCTDALDRLRRGDIDPDVLDRYGASGPGEFFAVTTEAFFTRPHGLWAAEPSLYRVVAGFYRQDPARDSSSGGS